MEDTLAERHNILVVDDEVATVRALERALRNEYSIFSATNGEEALAILEQEEIAVIIADHRMPGMTGVELLEKAWQEHPNTIRIILTAYVDENLLMDAINKVHANGFLSKPWDPGEITDIVGRWVGISEIATKITRVEEQTEYGAQHLQEKDEQIEDLQTQLAQAQGTREQLTEELANLRRQVTMLEFSRAEQRKRIGEILVEMGCLTRLQLARYLKKQKEEMESYRHEHRQKRLGEILLESDVITEEELHKALEEQRERYGRWDNT